MEQIIIKQNTPEWLEQRKTIIGASEVSAIMGVSPYSTAYQIWQYKKSKNTEQEDKEDSFICNEGHRLEDVARSKLELQLFIDLPPIVVRHKELKYCQASLDGCNLEEKVQVEIKYMGEEAWKKVKEENYCPEHYMLQVQYQLIATGFEFSYFCAINKNEEIAYFKIPRNESLFKEIIDATSNFYYNNMLKNIPPKLSKMDSLPIKSQGMVEALLEYKTAYKAKNEAENKIKELKASIIEQMEHNKMHSNKFKLSVSTTKSGNKSLRISISD